MRRILILGILFTSCASQNPTLDQIPDNLTINKSTKFLKINPYGNAPLSAELHLTVSEDPLTITVKGQDNADISYTWVNPINTVFPILGMYFDYTNTILISTPSLEKQIHVIITNKAPETIKSIHVLTNNRPDSSERNNFLDFFNPVGALTDLFATDNYGKIRWYFSSKEELHGMKFTTNNGEVLFSILNTVNPEILTFNMVGKKINTIKGPKTHTYNVPEADKRFHHDMFKRSNGNIIVLDKSQYGVEDIILELDPKGNIVQEIRIGDWIRKTVNNDPKDNTGLENFIFDSENNPFDEYRSGIRYPGMPPKQNAIDWAHINALSFDEEKEIIYLSFRQHGIFAFDYNTQLLKWIFIRDDYILPTENLIFYNFPDEIDYVYNIPALKPYILKGAQGPDHPHAVTFLSNNTFMVFDNSGNDGRFPEEGSRLLVFSIDENTASIEWEYRHRDTNNTLVYSQIVSDMDQTPFNSYTGIFGTKVPFTYIEVDQQKNILFDLRLELIRQGAGESDIALPIACPTSRLMQNGIFLYRSDYNSLYPSIYQSID
ncbi:MAG: aryl-sulfate sulfotransferase [Brevinema sp.]